MRRTYKYRIYPNKSQIGKLENTFSMCRHLYNWSLLERKKAHEKEEKSISYYTQQNNLPKLKKEKAWFRNVHSQVLQDVLKRLDRAYQNFFRRIKSKNELPGFPKFKKRGNWNSITYPQFQEKPDAKYIEVSKIGKIKIFAHRKILQNAKTKTLTISKEGSKWFACLSCDIEHQPPKVEPTEAVGLDLGLISYYYDSNGLSLKVPKFLRKSETRLKKAQKKLSSLKKRTPAFLKQIRVLQKIHCKVRNTRSDFLHKQSNKVLARADVVVLEKLNISGMSRRPKPKQDENGKYLKNNACAKAGLNKSINDASWHKFILFLQYKAEALGKTVKLVNPRYTSQKCSNCHKIVKKSLSTRTHRCKNCGLVLDRDHNAAINILRLGLESLGIKPLEAPTIALA